jgi:tyrosine-protein phosphatase 2/3
MSNIESDSNPQATSSPSMSAASVSRTSPLSSPLSTGRHGRYSSRPSPTRTPASTRSQVQTPRPAMNRHSNEQDESSPNYFNLAIDSSKSNQSSGGGTHVRANFSPPSSRVRSTAAVSPRVMPLDQNPEFEAFRRQSDLRSLKSNLNFSLPDPVEVSAAVAPAIQFSSLSSPQSSNISFTSLPKPQPGALESYLSEAKPRSPKRSLPSPYASLTDRPRRHSPAHFNDRETAEAPQISHIIQDEISHFSLPNTTSQSSLPPPYFGLKAETLPSLLASQISETKDSTPFSAPSHIATLIEAFEEQILILDLRVSTQYARSRIESALNLCIPTTLLKRPSYDTHKLAATFKSPEQRSKFERWRSCQYIVVYDGNASRPKDALSCVNMLKKFQNEGWSGSSYVIRGGFQDFSKQFPNLIHYDAGSSSGTDNESPSGVAPVIGGCPMPATKSAANPFFGNIRQNMDLIGGVGQIPVTRPRSMSNKQSEYMPQWLRLAADEEDQGKLVSEKFLSIEKDEQKRMQDALSDEVAFGKLETGLDENVKIAGIEKGNKNRYNNIWPYEHSRVKLQGVHEGGCDYVNANFVKTAWSHKRYIATQGPIPATFTVSNTLTFQLQSC